MASAEGSGIGSPPPAGEPDMYRQDSTAELQEQLDADAVEEAAHTISARRRKQQGGRLSKLWQMLRGKQNSLPQSNPDNWPRPTREDVERRPNRIVQINKPQEFSFCDNFIKTSKYEVWSFMPKFLAMEFHPRKKIANAYFLVVSCMQVIPEITSTLGYPILLLPLLFIVLIDMIFTIIEDVNRHKADATANAAKTVVLDKETGKWIVKERWEVAVGDFVKVHNREEIPADMLAIGVHERYRPNCGGVCYVETKSLDGETNLKIRQVQKVMLGRVEKHEDLMSFHGKVRMEHPNKSIAAFTGSLDAFLRDGQGANASVVGSGVGKNIENTGAGDSKSQQGAKPEAIAGSTGKNGGQSSGTLNVPTPPRYRSGSTSGRGRHVKEPITPDNLLLRGTVLRNTKWAVGLVISTGHDTKVMMSIAKAPEKSSHLNSRINTEIKGLALMLLFFCITGGVGSAIWKSRNEGFRDEVLLDDDDLGEEFVVQFFYYLLLLYGFVPISLYVSQNFIRFFQAWFMDQDLDMYHEPTDTPSRVRTMNLNEDLGQITHVFSDKTGTLTQNVMDFRKCTVGGKAYGKGMTEIGQAALKLRGVALSEDEMLAEDMAQELAAPHVNFYDPTLFRDLDAEVESGEGLKGKLTEFMTVLALCHTVIPERPDNGKEIVLSASSPDDEALVLGAKYFGVQFTERIDTSAVLYRQRMPRPLEPVGEVAREEYEVLRILGFNSVRKRMSVVVRCPDGQVKVLSKGADTTMSPLLREDTSKDLLSRTMDHLESFALEGLRTLMVGTKDMTNQEYATWNEAYDLAINDLSEVALQQAGSSNRIDTLMAEAEQGLTLLGGSAIEDKLQTGVGETIEKLVRGGIMVWVITGDKEETAINIAVACQLLWAEDRMDRCIINTKTCPTPMAVKERLLEEFDRYSKEMTACSKDGRSCKPRCLVIDGAAFSLIEDPPLTSLHGPLAGEESLADMAISSPSKASSMGDTTSQAGPSPSATAHKTPLRIRTSTHNPQYRTSRSYLKHGTPSRNSSSIAQQPTSAGADQCFEIRATGSGPVGAKSGANQGGGASAAATAAAAQSHAMGSTPVGGRGGGKAGAPVDRGDISQSAPDGWDEKQGDYSESVMEGLDIWGAVATSVVEIDDGKGDPEGDEEMGCKDKYDGESNRGSEKTGARWFSKSMGGGGRGCGESGVSGSVVDGEDAGVEMVMDAGDCLSAKEALLQFAGVCQAIVGCRMSPDQKRQLVNLIKDNNPSARTLAVGDGANDVPMIQAAHVGVGISGQEGLQAVNASDYSLAQFRFLQKLLLCHGRFNYRRMSFASSYLFYKSVSWAVPLFLYAFWNGLSGQVFYDYLNSTLWALAYTGLPIVLFGVYDMDVLPQTALRYPWLYRTGVDDELLTKTFFWGWIAQGVLESCWVTIPLMFLQSGGVISNGETPAVLAYGQAAFQSMTIVVNMKLIFVQKRWHWVEAALLTVSILLLFGISWFLNASTLLIEADWEWYGMQTALFQDPNYWAVSAYGVIGVLMRDVAWKAYHRWWHPKLHHVLVEMEKGHLKDIDLPVSLRRTYSLHDVIQEDTSSRMSRMRTQSLIRIETHRDEVMRALGASGSGYGSTSRGNISTSLSPVGGPVPTIRVRGLDGIVGAEGDRPKSAGGRLTSLASMLEGWSKSPLIMQHAKSSRRGRSAGSSPVYANLMFPEHLARRQAPGHEEAVPEQNQEAAAGAVRVGFAFSHDPDSNAHEIGMIMRNRPASIRRSSMPIIPASRLPAVENDDAFQAHVRALQAHRSITVEAPASDVSGLTAYSPDVSIDRSSMSVPTIASIPAVPSLAEGDDETSTVDGGDPQLTPNSTAAASEHDVSLGNVTEEDRGMGGSEMFLEVEDENEDEADQSTSSVARIFSAIKSVMRPSSQRVPAEQHMTEAGPTDASLAPGGGRVEKREGTGAESKGTNGKPGGSSVEKTGYEGGKEGGVAVDGKMGANAPREAGFGLNTQVDDLKMGTGGGAASVRLDDGNTDARRPDNTSEATAMDKKGGEDGRRGGGEGDSASGSPEAWRQVAGRAIDFAMGGGVQRAVSSHSPRATE